ncbi:catalase family peroxidase [Pseudidiomarina donghaiensis]|uniref:catalase family peroxidase n=1 Tax=Pseudidiomarina donghaiensis TaxID=519452 RepID=UPI003A971210
MKRFQHAFSPVAFKSLTLAVMFALPTAVVAHNHSKAEDDQRYALPKSATAQDFIAIFKEINGEHPGIRKAHARGVCAVGAFTPSTAAKQRFTSPLFQVDNAPLTLRFSMGGGTPNADERRGARGVGIQFELPNNQSHTIAGITSPVFSGATPNHFLGLLQWNLKMMRGEATREDVQKFMAAHPSMQPAIEWNRGRTASAEYTSATYYGIHAFWANTQGDAQKFRWQLVPQAGEKNLTKQQVESGPQSFLTERLIEQVKNDGAVTFDWHWTIGAADDPTNDPSAQWPADREQVHVGTITVTSAGGEACTPINFDPVRVARGIRPSDDPVLPIRSAAYAISFGQRLSNQ